MSQRRYKRAVGSELAAWLAYVSHGGDERCDWFRDLYPHKICVCGKSHTHSLTALKTARPLPKYLAPLSMEVLMNLTPFVALKQSHWSNKYETNKEAEQLIYIEINRYKLYLKKKTLPVITSIHHSP